MCWRGPGTIAAEDMALTASDVGRAAIRGAWQLLLMPVRLLGTVAIGLSRFVFAAACARWRGRNVTTENEAAVTTRYIPDPPWMEVGQHALEVGRDWSGNSLLRPWQ